MLKLHLIDLLSICYTGKFATNTVLHLFASSTRQFGSRDVGRIVLHLPRLRRSDRGSLSCHLDMSRRHG